MITVCSPPGIGDAYWLLMKLLPRYEKEGICFQVAQSHQYRAHFLNYIKGVEIQGIGRFSYLRVKKLAAMQRYENVQPKMYLEANTWLESGQRIEDYLPWLPTTFVMDWKISRAARARAAEFLKPKTIVVHTSSVEFNTKADIGVGKDWKPGHWIQILRHIYDRNPGAHVVWMGAKYDSGMADLLSEKFPIQVMLEEPADVVIPVLRGCQGFVSYQSGLSVISICEQIPTYMIYFDWLTQIQNSFCPKPSIGDPRRYSHIRFSELAQDLAGPGRWAASL